MVSLISISAVIVILFLAITESPVLSICLLGTYCLLVSLLKKVVDSLVCKFYIIGLMTTVFFLSTTLLAFPFSLNRLYGTGIVVFVVGHLLNWLVALSNGPKMPVINKPLMEEFVGLGSSRFRYKIMDESTRFEYLADIIYFSKPFPHAFSVGDVLISLGLWMALFGLRL